MPLVNVPLFLPVLIPDKSKHWPVLQSVDLIRGGYSKWTLAHDDGFSDYDDFTADTMTIDSSGGRTVTYDAVNDLYSCLLDSDGTGAGVHKALPASITAPDFTHIFRIQVSALEA